MMNRKELFVVLSVFIAKIIRFIGTAENFLLLAVPDAV